MSPYSHVGILKWEKGKPYVLEFREFKGSRKFPLNKYLAAGHNISVFRPVHLAVVPDGPHSYVVKEFSPDVADSIIREAEHLIGMDYGWKNIWRMALTMTPFVRLFSGNHKYNDDAKAQAFVCSTLVTYTYRKHFLDPTPNLADAYTKPGDLARSPLFSKIGEL